MPPVCSEAAPAFSASMAEARIRRRKALEMCERSPISRMFGTHANLCGLGKVQTAAPSQDAGEWLETVALATMGQ
eukprot:6894970-Lingulodinium_polyedra.AAC.1